MELWATAITHNPIGIVYSKPESHAGPKIVTIAVSTVHTASTIRTF